MAYTIKDYKKELQEIRDRKQEIEKRVELLKPIHEDIIIIERIDHRDALTFLEIDKAKKDGMIRTSVYGRVLKVNNLSTGDTIKDRNKNMLEVDDMVCLNAEVPYSLNIPGFDEIWVISISNVIAVDKGFPYYELREAMLRKKIETEEGINVERDLLQDNYEDKN